MFLNKVFLAGLLVLCTCFYSITVQGENVETTTLPTFGFWPALLNNMHNFYLSNRAKNNITLQELNQISNASVGELSTDITNLAEKLGKVSDAYQSLMSAKGNIFQTAAATATLTTQGLTLITVFNGLLQAVVTAFARLPILLIKAFTQNEFFLQNQTLYIPKEVWKKLTEIYNSVMVAVNILKNIIIAAQHQLSIATLQVAVGTEQAALPAVKFFSAARDQLEIQLKDMLVLLTRLEVSLAKIMQFFGGLVGGGVRELQNITRPITDVFRGVGTLIKNGFEGVGNVVGNTVKSLLGIFSHKEPDKSPSTESSKAPNTLSTTEHH